MYCFCSRFIFYFLPRLPGLVKSFSVINTFWLNRKYGLCKCNIIAIQIIIYSKGIKSKLIAFLFSTWFCWKPKQCFWLITDGKQRSMKKPSDHELILLCFNMMKVEMLRVCLSCFGIKTTATITSWTIEKKKQAKKIDF